jgi:hypothetical protein
MRHLLPALVLLAGCLAGSPAPRAPAVPSRAPGAPVVAIDLTGPSPGRTRLAEGDGPLLPTGVPVPEPATPFLAEPRFAGPTPQVPIPVGGGGTAIWR